MHSVIFQDSQIPGLHLTRSNYQMATIISPCHLYHRSKVPKNLRLVLTPLTLMMKSPSIDLENSPKLPSLRSHDIRHSTIFSDDQMPRSHSSRSDHLQSQKERPQHSQPQYKLPTKLSSVVTPRTFTMNSPIISKNHMEAPSLENLR